MSYDFLGDIDRIGMDAYKQGEEDAKKRAIEILASVLENWVHGGCLLYTSPSPRDCS